MAGKQYLEPEAFKLYRQNKTQKEIAESIGVSEQTLSGWKKKFEWESRRRNWQNSTQAISEKLMMLLAKDVQELDKLDSSAMDRINKAVKSIKDLDKSVDMLASTIQVMEDYVEYLQNKNPELADGTQNALPDFLMWQGNKYQKS